jgi:hypothetical protein
MMQVDYLFQMMMENDDAATDDEHSMWPENYIYEITLVISFSRLVVM